jgi:uncharacterized protein (DUF924 family)
MEHAEDRTIQERSVRCMEQLVDAAPTTMRELFVQCVDFAVRHRDIIARFGRFPHRNEILGRLSITLRIRTPADETLGACKSK